MTLSVPPLCVCQVHNTSFSYKFVNREGSLENCLLKNCCTIFLETRKCDSATYYKNIRWHFKNIVTAWDTAISKMVSNCSK